MIVSTAAHGAIGLVAKAVVRGPRPTARVTAVSTDAIVCTLTSVITVSDLFTVFRDTSTFHVC